MRGPSITFRQVGLELAGARILHGVDFDVQAGSIHCIIGPNGGGKTSLIRCLLGQMPHTGTVSIEWHDDKRTIGYVPQLLDFDRTLPVTVDDFMALVCERRRPAFIGLSRKHRAEAAEALARVGLRGKGRTKLGSLSGGERQRVLFAQALLPAPALLVLDEPMTSMDEVGEALFLDVIRELAADGVTIVWVAHDLAQVRSMADAVTCINRTVLFSGPPESVLGDGRAEVLFTASGETA